MTVDLFCQGRPAMIKISETRRLVASAKNSGIGVSIGLFSFKYILVVVRLPGSGKLCVPLQDLISGRAFFLRVKISSTTESCCVSEIPTGEGKGVAVGIPAEIVPCVRKLLYHGKYLVSSEAFSLYCSDHHGF